MEPIKSQAVGPFTAELHHDDAISWNPLDDWDGMAAYAEPSSHDKERAWFRADGMATMLMERHDATAVFGIYTDGYRYARAERIDPELPEGDQYGTDRYSYYVYDTPAYRDELAEGADVAEQVGLDARVLAQWVAGEVYGWAVTNAEGDTLESVWGYYDDDDAWSEALETAEALARDAERAPQRLTIRTTDVAWSHTVDGATS